MSWVGNGKARGKPQRRAMYRMAPQKFGRGTMTALRFDTGKQTARHPEPAHRFCVLRTSTSLDSGLRRNDGEGDGIQGKNGAVRLR
jgi:hypothetical protein